MRNCLWKMWLVAGVLLVSLVVMDSLAVGADDFKLPDTVRFDRDIKPIFSNTCFVCHGPDEKARKAKLRLDVRDVAIASRKDVRAIVPGKPSESEAYYLISEAAADEQMPPADFNKQLTPRQIALVKKWIEQGAAYGKHWAFVPPKRPVAPKVQLSSRVHNPIDSFAFAKLEREKLTPSAVADKYTLIRRVTLDLTGLLPTPAEVDAFVIDTSEKAYEKVVDRLLASPRYGEHMARHWLDVGRYADTNGYQYDRQRNQWVWRDWVIHAFNTNKPFDQFTIEQLAGDLVPNATDQTRLATGFNRNHPITIEGGVIEEEYRTEYVIDRVVTNTTAWMGLTFICARCHDHKYDPISQDDFYSFMAFFNQMPERGINAFSPKLRVASPLATGATKGLDAKIAAVQKTINAEMARVGVRAAAQWEARVRSELVNQWKVITPKSVKSTGGATMTKLPDHSIFATGKKPANDVYEIEFVVGTKPLRSVRLEALTHASHANKSTGRGSNGNFVLTEFEVAVAPANAKVKAYKNVKIIRAEADYQQKGYPIALAIDGKRGRAGWAVDGNTKIENRTAVFTTGSAIVPGSRVRIRMIHEFGGMHHIGRFRLAATSGDHAAVPLAVQSLMAVEVKKRTAAQKTQLKSYLTGRFGSPALAKALATVSQLQLERTAATSSVPDTMVLTEKPGMRKTFVLDRGEYDKPLKHREVQARVPLAIGSLPNGAPANRLALAKWLVAKDQPLTARVTVNRYWQRLFGTGLVKTTEDFGSQGDYPSHPQLLDWLAVDFMESGWDVKALMKTMVTSATYRQSSRITPTMFLRDPENRMLARGPRLRMDAEVIRDSALALSGKLGERIGGASVFPYHPKGLWLEINNRPGYSSTYKQDTGLKLYRRSMYTFWKRTVPPPTMATFDAPEREFCVVRRSRTNTPLQAFVMMHDPQFVEAARNMAERMMKEGGDSVEKRLAYGFKLVLSRPESVRETTLVRDMFNQRLAQYSKDADAAKKLLSVGESARDQTLNLAEHAAYMQVARLLLNLSEFLTKG